MNNRQKVAIVTGANSGIGAEIAQELARENISVVIHYLENPVFEVPDNITFYGHFDNGKQRALEIRDKIRTGGGNAEIFGGDLAGTDIIIKLVKFAEDTFGTPTILINNAAHCELPDNLFETTADTIDRHFIVNTRSAVLLTKEVSKRIVDKNIPYGRIVNISTDASQCFPNQISYGASKAALEAYTKSLAVELGKHNITVNCVAPGPIQTGWIDNELEKQVLEVLPIKRLGVPKDIADTVSFLVSEKASWLTGQIIKVSGGHYI
jgi:3-oxoacyl-[acyl-carrier protein] reductase